MAYVERLGLSPVFSGPDNEGNTKDPPIANIVFVHGLRGHPRSTWECAQGTGDAFSVPNEPTETKKTFWQRILEPSSKHTLSEHPEDKTDSHGTARDGKSRPKSAFWPADFLPKVVPRTKIFTYGYNADVIEGVFEPNNRNSIIQHANDLMVKMERGLRNDLPLILVAHSLGGIVVKAAMQRCRASVDAKYRALLSRVHAIIFCGTPHRGADAAAWGQLATNIVAMALQGSNSRLLSDLRVDSQILDLIQEDFLKILHGDKIRVHSFQESRGLSGIKGFSGKVVDDFSSRLGYSLETTETIDANHMEMVRGAGYRVISDVIKDYIDGTENKRNEPVSPKPGIKPYVYLDRFYFLDYESFLFQVAKRHRNTCLWFIDNPAFRQWKDGSGSSNFFWLHGYPGLGKSVLARFTVETLLGYHVTGGSKPRSSPMVCYFFCSDNDERAKSPRNLLASIIHQLLFEDPSLAETVEHKYLTITKEITESVWRLWNILGLIFAGLRSRLLYIVLDALDELDKTSWATFLEQLRQVVQPSMHNIRILITSRSEPELEKIITPWNIAHLAINDSIGNQGDLAAFLRDVVHEYASENSFDEDITRTICEELIKRADGMFLWASLAWEHFKDGVGSWTISTLRRKLLELQQLPPGMERLYYRLLSSVDKRMQGELTQALNWIVVSRRPISIKELSVALSLIEKPECSKDMNVRVSLPAFLKRTCPHLIRVNRDKLTVVHQSFKDFLLQVHYIQSNEREVLNQFYIDWDKANCQLARDCMIYLGLGDIEIEASWSVEGDHNLRDAETLLLKQFVFLDYASSHWSRHICGLDDDLDFFHAFKRVLSRTKNYQTLCILGGSRDTVPDLPLFIACRRGLFKLAKRLVDDGHDINALNKGSHIIHLWGLRMTDDQLGSLLQLGADVNGYDNMGQTFLTRLVAEARFDSTRKMLKNPRVSVNAVGRQGVAPLHAAVLHETPLAHELFQILMVRPELDLNAEDSFGRTPLTLAIHWGKEEIVKTLLKTPGVNITTAKMQGESPLINAACQGWTDLVLSILNRIDNIDGFSDSTGRTILHWTIISGMIDALELALQKECTILSVADNRGMSALHYAAQEGQYHASNLLLSRGARPTGTTTFGETALHLAAARGHKRILQALLEHSPSVSAINEKDSMGWTIAHRAVISGNDDLIKYLVSLEGLDLTKVDRHGRTPVAFAASFASLTALEALLEPKERHDDLYFVDSFGNTLLHLAAKGNNESTLPFLLKALPQSRNQTNAWGKTPRDLIPSSSQFRLLLALLGMRHSENFKRNGQSFYYKARREKSPDRSGWTLVCLDR